MMTAKERSISPYEERGSEVNMADSLGIKDAAKESSNGQNFNQELQAWIQETKIAAASSLEAEIVGFKPMADNDNVLTCEEVADWLRTLGRMTPCQSFYWVAEAYAHRLVVEESMNKGWIWLRTTKEEWLTLVTEEEYEVLERFGFDRGTDVSPSEGAGVATLEAQMISLQKTQDEQKTAETVPRGDPDGTGKTQMHMVQMEMDLRELQKEVDDMRAGAETLEALKPGILNRTMVLQEYERGEFIKGPSAEIEQDPGGQIIKVHIAQIEQDANKVEGAILISADITADQKSVARWLIDPGGGANTYMNNPGEGQGAPAGGHQARDWNIQDPGGGENIDIGGSQPDFETCVASLVNHEVPRKIYEVQEIKNHRSIKEEADETGNETQMNKGHRKMYQEEIKMELDLRGPDGTGPKGDPGGTGFTEKENRKEDPKGFLKKRATNEAIYEVICGG